jgi:hypothetical protein
MVKQAKPVPMFEDEPPFRFEEPPEDHDDLGFALPELDALDLSPLGALDGLDIGDVGAVRASQQLDGLDDDALLAKPRRILASSGWAAEDAYDLAERIHERGPGTHRAILKGSFLFGDFVVGAAQLCGPAALKLATLSYGHENVDALATAFADGHLTSLDLITSDYFVAHYRHTLWRMLVTSLPRDKCRYAVCRTHAKVALLIPDRGPSWTIEGSANLRSCDSIEQLTVTVGDDEAIRFHQKWMSRIIERFALGGRASLGKTATWRTVTNG